MAIVHKPNILFPFASETNRAISRCSKARLIFEARNLRTSYRILRLREFFNYKVQAFWESTVSAVPHRAASVETTREDDKNRESGSPPVTRSSRSVYCSLSTCESHETYISTWARDAKDDACTRLACSISRMREAQRIHKETAKKSHDTPSVKDAAAEYARTKAHSII